MFSRVGRLSTQGDAPGPRCGHSLTACGGRLLLFGGATALETSGAAAAGIRLAGATSEVHSLDVRGGVWTKLQPAGEPPSPRAAHAAAAVGSMVVMQARPRGRPGAAQAARPSRPLAAAAALRPPLRSLAPPPSPGLP